MTPAPLIAVELGWATAEIGRQPWIVYGVMKTADGVSPLVTTPEVLVSLLGFIGVYVALFALWLFLVRRVLMAGPEPPPAGAVAESPPRPLPEHGRPTPAEVLS